MNKSDDEFTTTQAAVLLSVSGKTIRNWEAAGKIKASRTLGGHGAGWRRFSLAEIERVKNEMRNENGWRLVWTKGGNE